MSGTNLSGTYTIQLIPPILSLTPGLTPNCSGPFAGWPVPQLQAALLQAQTAFLAVVTGGQPVMVNYAEGQGHRQVTYTKTNANDLRNLIRDLQYALGTTRRRAIGVRM
ncbi:MAG: gpW family head-tail joining protein [Acidocella sp.]|nr:gpW family head-tail joining protein [Acidocella sp.]